MLNPTRFRLGRSGTAILAVSIALLVKLLLDSLLPAQSPCLILFGAIALSIGYGGRVAGMIATGLVALLSEYFLFRASAVAERPLFSWPVQLSWMAAELLVIVGLWVVLARWFDSPALVRDESRFVESLEESQAQLRQAIASAPFPLAIHAEDGEILQMSHVITELTGYSRSEVPTISDWIDKVHDDLHQRVRKGVEQLYNADQQVDEGEFTIRTKTGRQLIWDISSVPLGTISDGRRVVISMAADVTERKRVETALTVRVRQQAIVAQLGQLALRETDLSRLMDEATRQIEEGLAAEWINLWALLPGDVLQLQASSAGLAEAEGLLRQSMNSQAGYTVSQNNPVVVDDWENESRFGQCPLFTTLKHLGHPLSSVSVAIPGEGSQPYGVIEAHTTQRRHFTQEDINFLQAIANVLGSAVERKHAENEIQQFAILLEHRVEQRTAQLEASNKELEAFSYSVSHDLRAPLRYINGFVNLLKKRLEATAPDEQCLHYLDVIMDSTRQAGTLIDDLLEFSRTGRIKLSQSEVDFNQIVQTVIRSLEPLTRDRSISWHLRPLPLVRGDPATLRLAMFNLIENAVKYTQLKENAEISIYSLDDPHETVIVVQDNGIGFDMRYVHKLFGVFQRLHHDPRFEGTGIGLATVQRIIHRHGGRVWAEAGLDQGARFYLALPKPVSFAGDNYGTQTYFAG